MERITKSSACSFMQDWINKVLFAGSKPTLSQSMLMLSIYSLIMSVLSYSLVSACQSAIK